MSYKNFSTAVYCTVQDLNEITDLNEFKKRFDWLSSKVRIEKVYLETYRTGTTITKEKMLVLKHFFETRGIKTSGGITATVGNGSHYTSLCYTNKEHREKLKEIAEFTASLFDEIILDDFFFTNCKCDSCIKAKGNKTWAQFRLDLMKEAAEELVLRPARRVNNRVNVIIKFPNWYDSYQENGYNLGEEPQIFDAIYTGTETRDTQHTLQHLPKYLSYFVMCYLENVKPGKNLGGWFDPFECGDISSYAEQADITLFAKPKEVTLFCLGAILNENFSLCAPAVGQTFDDLDKTLENLENPTGIACYIPYNSKGENFLHNYLGMCGIPFEPYPEYPEKAKNIFLTETAAEDRNVLNKLEASLKNGANVTVTTGFLAKMQDLGFDRLASVRATGRKLFSDTFSCLGNEDISLTGLSKSDDKVMLPEIEYASNDFTVYAVMMGKDNMFPVIMGEDYSKGSLNVLAVPDDFGSFEQMPHEVLTTIRKTINKNSDVTIESKAGISLFTYANNAFALHSFEPVNDEIVVAVNKNIAKLKNLATGKVIEGEQRGEQTVFRVYMTPHSNRFFQITR